MAVRGLLIFLALDNLLAAVVAVRAHVMASMHFAGSRLDRSRRIGKEIVRAMHSAARCGLLVLLDCHDDPREANKVRDCTQPEVRIA